MTDVWHLLRSFASAVGRREARAYERISDEEEKKQAFLAVLPCAPGELARLERAQERCVHAVALYDQVQTLLDWLREATRPVDAPGRVRTEEQIQGDWEAALDLIDTVPAEKSYALERKLRGRIDELRRADWPNACPPFRCRPVGKKTKGKDFSRRSARLGTTITISRPI